MNEQQSTPNDKLRNHMRIFAEKIKEHTKPGLSEEEIQLKAVEETNKLAPLTEVEFKLLKVISGMSDRQRRAFLNPCRTPFALLNRGYHKDIFESDLFISTSITLPDMQGEAAWHASAALLDATKRPRRLTGVSERHRSVALRVLSRLLAGVGVDPGEVIEADSSLQFIKQLSAEELEVLKGGQINEM